MTMRALLVVAGMLATASPAWAQAGRPRADVTPVVASTPVTAGGTAHVSLRVRLPENVHVQAHEPRDPSLIPTVLTVEAPPGITVGAVVYPPPTELTQAGRREALAVLGPEFVIHARLAVAATTPAGELAVPAVLRYQACNDTVCFPPARATATWRLTVESRPTPAPTTSKSEGVVSHGAVAKWLTRRPAKPSSEGSNPSRTSRQNRGPAWRA